MNGQIVPNVRAVATKAALPGAMPTGAGTSFTHAPTNYFILQGTSEQLVAKLKDVLAGHVEQLASMVEAS